MNLTQSIIDEMNNNPDTKAVEIVQKCLAANPYAKETFNLTLQLEISNRIPDFANVLKSRAAAGETFDENEKKGWLEVAKAKVANREKITGVKAEVYGH